MKFIIKSLGDLFIGKFKNGQPRLLEANDGEQLVHVFDNDVTTYVYSLPDYVSKEEFEFMVNVAFDSLKLNESGEIIEDEENAVVITYFDSQYA